MDQQTFNRRKNGIGASEMSIILGLSEYDNSTPLTVYLSKLPEALPNPDTFSTRRGKALEGAILDLYEQEYGAVKRSIETRYSPSHPFIFATPDAERVDNSRPVDAKSVNSRVLHKWGTGADEVPTAYLIQSTVQQFVFQQSMGEIVALLALDELRRYEIAFDAELMEMILEAATQFWKRVENREPPEPVDGKDVERRYPFSVSDPIEATPTIASTYHALLETKKEVKRITAEEERLTDEIKKYLKDKDTLLISSVPVLTWKKSKNGTRLDGAALAKEQPEIYNKYLKPHLGSRRLIFKGDTSDA